MATLEDPDIVWLENRTSTKTPGRIIQSKVYARRFVEKATNRELVVCQELNNVWVDVTMRLIERNALIRRNVTTAPDGVREVLYQRREDVN